MNKLSVVKFCGLVTFLTSVVARAAVLPDGALYSGDIFQNGSTLFNDYAFFSKAGQTVVRVSNECSNGWTGIRDCREGTGQAPVVVTFKYVGGHLLVDGSTSYRYAMTGLKHKTMFVYLFRRGANTDYYLVEDTNSHPDFIKLMPEGVRTPVQGAITEMEFDYALKYSKP